MTGPRRIDVATARGWARLAVDGTLGLADVVEARPAGWATWSCSGTPGVYERIRARLTAGA